MTRINEASADIARQAIRSEVSKQTQSAEQKQRTEAQQTTRPATPSDGVERGAKPQAPAMKSTGQAGATAASGSSPFAGLVRIALGLPLAARTLAASTPVDQDLAPDVDVMVKLASLEQGAAGLAGDRGAPVHVAADKVRTGIMLMLNDSVEQLTKPESKVSKGLVANIAESIVEAKGEKIALETVKNAMFAQRGTFGAGMDVNAYVQAVLRESYLLQNEIMKDYADRVDYWNETKKAIRNKLIAARKYRKALAAALKARETDPEAPLPAEITGDLFLNEGEAYDFERNSAGAGDVGGGDELGDDPTNDPPDGGTVPGVPEGLSVGDSKRVAPLSASQQEAVSLVRDMLADVRSGNWDHAKQAYADFFYKSFAGSDTIGQGRQALATALPHLEAADIRVLLNLAEHASRKGIATSGKNGDYDKTKPDHKRWLGEQILDVIFDNARPSQLAAARDILDPEIRARLDVFRPGFKDDANRYSDSYNLALEELGSDVTNAPELQGMASLWAEYVSTERNHDGSASPAQQVALRRMMEQMWTLPADDAQAFLKGIAETGEGDGNTVFALLESADWKKLFADATAEEWSFLADAGGQAAAFYAEWSGEAPAAAGTAFSAVVSGLAGNQQQSWAPGDVLAGAQFDAPDLDAPPTDSTGGGQSAGAPPSVESVDDYIKALEEELQTAGDDAQLANVDLQNALQKQQQTLQMMSNISKMLHDTAMSIIRKIGS